MDFFQHQDVARRKTGRLVVFFLLAVAGIVLLVYLAAAGIAAMMFNAGEQAIPAFFHLKLFVIVSLATVAVVTLGSLYKISELRGGGRVVAEAMGGRLVAHPGDDPNLQKLLNVVEEMAIASGTPLPPVYVMEDEAGINAFAAGYSPRDAVIGVTRGCIDSLSRHELQGVIAHEFSHILNGDMRLNIKLIGLIHGILVLGLIGGLILRGMRHVRVGSTGSRGKNNSGGALAAVMLFALALLVLGYLGTFFGRLIKAAVSRQREFLADASAVQFTRYPQGIAGALKKIGGITGSQVNHPRAEESSHMFFGQAISSALGFLFATHPPLKDRIKRLDPQWDGSFSVPPMVQTQRTTPPRPVRTSGVASMLSEVGVPEADHVRQASRLLASVPPRLLEAAHQTLDAQGLIFAMLLSQQPEARVEQVKLLAARAPAQAYAMARGLEHHARGLSPAQRLPLASIALAALRQMSSSQVQTFRGNVRAMAAMDRQTDLFEWSLSKLVDRQFRPAQDLDGSLTLRQVAPEAAMLLSALSYVGQSGLTGPENAFRAGAEQLGALCATVQLSLRTECSFEKLDAALERLGQLQPTAKRTLLLAAATTAVYDQRVTTAEGELVRALAATLGVPLPPILEETQVEEASH